MRLESCPRPIAEFSRYETIKLSEAVKDAAQDSKHDRANYFRLTSENLRSMLHSSCDGHFRDYLLPLLGDKDQEKVLEIVVKVEKHTRGRQERSFARPPRRDTASVPYKSFR